MPGFSPLVLHAPYASHPLLLPWRRILLRLLSFARAVTGLCYVFPRYWATEQNERSFFFPRSTLLTPCPTIPTSRRSCRGKFVGRVRKLPKTSPSRLVVPPLIRRTGNLISSWRCFRGCSSAAQDARKSLARLQIYLHIVCARPRRG